MSDKSTAPPPGTLLMGKYRVEREIGSGGMAVVVEAAHVDLGQRVAIKLLDAQLASSPEIVARFLREARIAANLPSEHVTKVTDVGQTDEGVLYLVMELLTGHDLSVELARRGKLAVSAAVDLVLQACEGVAEAHAAGLVHRDLKPANLFLARRSGRAPIVKVLDFGLSTEPPSDKRAMALTAAGAIFGTPQYMSPEQIQSARDVDARSDQHALAMILFELLTGRAAYVAPNVTKLMVAIAVEAPPHARALRGDVPGKLDEALVRALAKRPEGRFVDLAGFATALAPFGTPAAAQSAANVRAALSPREPLQEPAGGSSATASDMQITSPLHAGMRDGSQTDLTSSADPVRGTRRARRVRRAALAVLALAAGIGGAAVVLRRGHGPEPAPTTAARAVPAAETSTLPVPVATAAPVASATPPVTPDPGMAPASAAAPPASSSAAPPTGPQPRPGGARPGGPKSGVGSPLGVFGERK